ncbi:hypothetical protein [Pseudomonas knackmussii]|uniref:hypothetical protein n=1 Tax=Pseudomonas knackmussii TaxID=65741 RepID=UPI0013631D33|nr:hypothetical protein [Pseudomonas knackmussii]
MSKYQTVNAIIEERDRLKAEAQALREEVAALRARVVVIPERLGTTTSKGLMDVMTLNHHLGWNACLDELARLNGKVVSEGLLRRIVAEEPAVQDIGETFNWQFSRDQAMAELRALLGEGKEHE